MTTLEIVLTAVVVVLWTLGFLRWLLDSRPMMITVADVCVMGLVCLVAWPLMDLELISRLDR